MSKFIASVMLILWCVSGYAQIEDVIIENYYSSGPEDATDTFGGHLDTGSMTYRIFIDMKEGSRLHSIYGSADHPLVFTSTEPFFNHYEDGITFAKDLNRSRYGTGTVPLDSYITLGQCSRPFSQGAYMGVPKSQDVDGSIVGGINNDGGSAEIPGGLLTNQDGKSGIPLIESDGLTFSNILPSSWVDIGFIDISSGIDTTIFGSGNSKTNFKSSNAILRNAGTVGADTVRNEVLVAQFTTKGTLAFEINLEISIEEDGTTKIVKYVATSEHLADNEVFEPLLKYPYECGCTDPLYLEANTTFACTDNSKCLTPIIFGCMDSLACNYDERANFNLPELCCYVGFCHDLDISIVCPDLQPRGHIDFNLVRLFPNPVTEQLKIDMPSVLRNELYYQIVDVSGKVIKEGIVPGQEKRIDINALDQGYYFLRLEVEGQRAALPFVKIQ